MVCVTERAPKSFSEFSIRILGLKLNDWNIHNAGKYISCTFSDNIHMVPKYEIYVDENLSFTLRVLLWSVPASHDLYTSNQFSMKNITLSHLINNIKLYSICPGLNNQFACGCIQHSVSKLFSMESSSSSYPLHQSKWYRAPSSCLFAILLLSAVHVLVLRQKKC